MLKLQKNLKKSFNYSERVYIRMEYSQGGNMNIQSISYSSQLSYSSWKSNSNKDNGDIVTSDYNQTPNSTPLKLNAVQLQYSENFEITTYSNNDGDTAQFASNDKANELMAAMQKANTPEEWKAIIAQIKEEYANLKSNMVDTLTAGISGKEPKHIKKGSEIKAAEVPEYWNAENTSQRIVDFALSFFGQSSKTDSEFFNMIKNAVEEGFAQAKDILGNLPGEIGKLMSDTYNLTMEKLDNWAKGQGIGEKEVA